MLSLPSTAAEEEEEEQVGVDDGEGEGGEAVTEVARESRGSLAGALVVEEVAWLRCCSARMTDSGT